ncbi:LysR family transcriptional regulator [Xanthomonas sp. A2111]|uniref:LysR family transcriptional regulator n=1 Tax=Xanthomonas hawaiiensis TaxID=3003247 RepID=A0ABU2I765_9XANT|nr:MULTISPECIES: LysR family transcriptional regulator [unclassified Xanthomonas]MBO9826779.1 LysR family transcriptional regulator [Xanthomonas sp. A2111]MBO9874985.1 LysR family transcriptional regulator [Xanthomonas sp. D-93]MDS9993989.1 LysR family transcriptional regulator [Xanthomonas sp. A2111]WNH45719.1 LysR family transcriptional regulator [Xanthomonas sp. A6251]
MMNLIHWRLYVAVVECGSISAGAARCGITQSGASQAIAQMEHVLGAALLLRERGRIRPTPFGTRALEHARAMLVELGQIQALARAQRAPGAASLRVAGFASSRPWLAPRLRAFERAHPHTGVVWLEGSDEEVEAWLAAGNVDLGVVLDPAPDRDATVFGEDEWLAVLPPALARPQARDIALTELLALPFVLATGGCWLHAQRLAEREGLTIADLRLQVRDWSSAWTLVRDGAGASLLPASVLPAARDGVQVLPLQPRLQRRFALVAAAHVAPAALQLRGFLAEAISSATGAP